jgi:hypothetical protein
MRYLVTRDLLEDSYTGATTVALWKVDAIVEMDDEGFWGAANNETVVEELHYSDFKEKYKVDIAPGTRREMEVVVHWVDKEE